MFLNRFRDATMPYQTWNPFPPEAIVLVKNCLGEPKIAVAKDLWWGYERDNEEGVITQAKRLDRVKV